LWNSTCFILSQGRAKAIAGEEMLLYSNVPTNGFADLK
jgi:hypothetical protein